MHGDPPQLTSNNNGVESIFTIDFINFVNLCLMKDEAVRPKYTKLLEHPFIVTRFSRKNKKKLNTDLNFQREWTAGHGRLCYFHSRQVVIKLVSTLLKTFRAQALLVPVHENLCSPDSGVTNHHFRMQGNEPRPTETMLEKMDITDKNGSP